MVESSAEPTVRHARLYAVARGMLIEFLRQRAAWRVVDGVPEDAVISGVTWEPEYDRLVVRVEHPSFPAVSDRVPLPVRAVTFQRMTT